MMVGHKLKGGALYIALIICIVISIILSVFILIAHFNQRQIITKISSEQLSWNLRSGFQLAQSDHFSVIQNNRWFKHALTDDSLKIKVLQWGAFQLIEAQTKNSHQLLSEAGLYGASPSQDTALFMEDSGRPINLAGSVQFKANVYFPATGYKTAYIEGASAVIDPSIHHFVKRSGGSVPSLKKILVDNLVQQIRNPEAFTDSLGSLDQSIIYQGFSAKTLLIRSGNLNLSGYKLSHNIKLVANGEIVIDSTTRLDNVLLIAAKVRFKKGSKGVVQVIASDSVVVEDGCYLSYPSSLTVVNYENEGIQLKGIFIGEKSRVEGSVMAINNGVTTQKVIVTTRKECELYGIVYSSNYGSIQGTLYGTLYCAKLLLQTPSAVYENHLLNCTIDPQKYGLSLYIPAVFEKSKALKCVKYLH